MAEHHDVCILLDKLTLEMLRLMENSVQCKVNVENSTNNASIHIAKSRYIMGQANVSSVQLPTENTPDFAALATVSKNTSSAGLKCDNFDVIHKKVELNKNIVNPLRWFGILVPQNLHQAQNLFSKALDYIAECANVQGQLFAAYKALAQMRYVKYQLTPEE